MDYLKGKKNYVWAYMGNARMWQALNNYGDRLLYVGVFSFEIAIDGTISETGIDVSMITQYRNKWPHIKWNLTCMNHGYSERFTALRNNTNGARDTFLSELVRIMNKYPWCNGVDIDLEKGGGYENRASANTLFQLIYQTVKNYNPAKEVNICLPGMTGVQGSVGGENWCVYAELNPYCDTATIMSYGMAWAGSAPGPVSPRFWLDGVYNYAVTVMNPSKLFMGLPGYGWNWRIDHNPGEFGNAYRGESHTYYAIKNWMIGVYNYTDDYGIVPPQPYIPWIGYYDWYENWPWALPHVYDYATGWDYTAMRGPIAQEDYNRHNFLTCYKKVQNATFGDVYVDKLAFLYEASSGTVNNSGNDVILGLNGSVTYSFTTTTGQENADLALSFLFSFWDKNRVRITLDASVYQINETRLYWPYWRYTFWIKCFGNIAPGQHILTVAYDGVEGIVFREFKVCSAFSGAPTAGEASFSLAPRSFKDVNGNMVDPNKGFILTNEVLRRDPDSALIWYEDFQDSVTLQDIYWTTLSGSWSVWHSDEFGNRSYSMLEGNGQLAWKYAGFGNQHIRCRVAMKQSSSGRAGVFVGSLFLCVNFD
ncbi:MAG: glycosyl hydrolase, partial [Clostridiales bacterium]|nr:glycosyl hydrolase [Clostridiales bacterium]